MPSYIFAIIWVITYHTQNLWKLPNFSTTLDEVYTYGKSSDELTTKADDSKQNMCLLGFPPPPPKIFWINLRNWTWTILEAYTYLGKSSDELTTKADDSKQNMRLLVFFRPALLDQSKSIKFNNTNLSLLILLVISSTLRLVSANMIVLFSFSLMISFNSFDNLIGKNKKPPWGFVLDNMPWGGVGRGAKTTTYHSEKFNLTKCKPT